ncbi:MAG: phosphodiester glycosidase family protein [Pseudomonadota bacterium]
MLRHAPWLLLALWPLAALAEPACESDRFEDVPFTACILDPSEDQIRLFYQSETGDLFGNFAALDAALGAEGSDLILAMNGGMYHSDRRPVGHYIEDGKEIVPLIRGEGPGNFGLLPNGVFCLDGDEAMVMETEAFAKTAPMCDFATQSGPLLVAGGALHPRFLPDGSSEFIRNGVGVTEDGEVVVAISDGPVNFHRFARLFRDRLNAPDALYIDGKVSRLFAAPLGRSDLGLPMGPIFAVIDTGGA